MTDAYRDYYAQKQRDLPAPRPITEVPEHLRDRYPTLESYLEALHDFLNGN